MEAMQLMPVRANRMIQPMQNHYGSYATTELLKAEPNQTLQITPKRSKHFIESNTKEVDMFHLKKDCVVPVFSKDNECTISHPSFIETVLDAAHKFLPGETIEEPEIMVSHIIKGRVPEAIHKPVIELLDADKTIYYERMAFCFEVPTIYEDIEGNRLNLSIGGVRSFNHENLYGKKGAEKFKVFIGFKNIVCCNLCVSTDGYKEELKAMSCSDLFNSVLKMFQQYNPAQHLHLMNAYSNSYLTEHQFAQFLGKTRLYQCLPPDKKKLLPEMLMTDTQINLVAKSYYQDENFAIPVGSNEISLWRVYNLLTGANKSSYIDNFLDRSLNATQLTEGLNKALYADCNYQWFLE